MAHDPFARLTPEPGAGDETAAQAVSSPDPPTDLAATSAGEPEAPVSPSPAAPAEDEQPTPAEHPEQPASPEPAAPDEPSRPHGDDLGEEAIPAEPANAAAGQPDLEDHEGKLEHDLEELAAKAQKADEYLELAQRTKADFENYRKRAGREAAAAQERGIAKLARELLPAVDNLDRALRAAETDTNGGGTLASGI